MGNNVTDHIKLASLEEIYKLEMNTSVVSPMTGPVSPTDWTNDH
jgi:hypothetical protein